MKKLHQEAGLDDEHAAVPAVVTRAEVRGGSAGVGLLLKLADDTRVGRVVDVEAISQTDVAEPSGGVRGRDADGDKEVVASCDDSLGNGTHERVRAVDHMVRSETAEYGFWIPASQHGGREPDSGCALLGARLSEEVAGEHVGELVAHGITVDATGDYHHAGGAREREEAVPCGLDERAAAEGEVKEKFRASLAGEGPEAGASAPCGHDGPEALEFAGREWEGGEGAVTQGRWDIDR